MPGASTFFTVVRGERLRLAPLANGLFVLGHGGILELRGNDAVASPEFTAGTRACNGAYQALVGRWPEDAWLAQGVRIYRHRGQEWRVERRLDYREIDFDPSVAGQLTIAFVPTQPEQPNHYRIIELPAGRRAPPVPTNAAHPDATCRTRIVVPAAFARTPDGTLRAFGNDCGRGMPGGGAPLVEVWAPGKTRAAIETLPDPEHGTPSLARGGVFVRDEHDIWVGGHQFADTASTYVAHFDGKAWSSVGGPPVREAGVSSLSSPSSGVVWATLEFAEQPLWKFDASGWRSVEVPTEAGKLRRVVARGPADIWLEAERGIYHTTPPAQIFSGNLGCSDTMMDEDEVPRLVEP